MKTLSSPVSQPSIDKAELAAYMCDCKNSQLIVTLNKGYDDNGSFVVKSSEVITISGADFEAIMDVAGDAGKDVCDQIEDGIWAYLDSHGVEIV